MYKIMVQHAIIAKTVFTVWFTVRHLNELQTQHQGITSAPNPSSDQKLTHYVG